MTASWESNMLLGTYLSAANKKCMACVILSSAITLGCVRYSCKHSAGICNNQCFCFAVYCLYAAVVVEHRSYTKSFTSSLVPGFVIA